jgi:sec-independent protein translocase protein TatA
MPNLGGWEFVILIGVLVLLFGAKRLPDMARSIGQSARVFKGEMKGMKSDEQPGARTEESTPAELPAAPPPAPAQPPVQPPRLLLPRSRRQRTTGRATPTPPRSGGNRCPAPTAPADGACVAAAGTTPTAR